MYNTYTVSNFKSSRGKVLRKLRVHVYDMSQADFGKYVLKCSQGAVCSMELGKSELSPTAEKLLEEYGNTI